ncbi:hypothetical protein [Novosphingobium sp.]|uniref:hypothetical protein n=1 Tax=Novosphingobium sp. TaxID=1874826 RepID=UPI00262CB7E7|nr:hypothetical protein [Novosphingobium sp.]
MADPTDVVRDLLFNHVSSPSLKHIRNGFVVSRLAAEIVAKLNQNNTAWLKWNPERERLVIAAAPCWVPIPALAEHLNAMPGPHLTRTDVAERMRDFQERDRADYPKEDLRASCEALFAREAAEGTELPAIIGALQEHIEQEWRRLQTEREARYRAILEAERVALERRFLAGADCKWTPLSGSKELFCRMNGRAYRLSPIGPGRFELNRINEPADPGVFIGQYKQRRDATKALSVVAYSAEL